MTTYVGQNRAVVAWLVLVLFVCRPSQYLVPILLMFAISTFQLEDLYLARCSVQTRASR